MSKEDNSISFGMGLLAGILGGVVAAILYAPKSGAETREDVKNYVNDFAQKHAPEIKEEMANFVKNVPRRIRNFAQYFSNYAHTQTNNGLEEAFAEIEALINNVKIPKFVYRRAHLLQENFPKTIAYLMQRRI